MSAYQGLAQAPPGTNEKPTIGEDHGLSKSQSNGRALQGQSTTTKGCHVHGRSEVLR